MCSLNSHGFTFKKFSLKRHFINDIFVYFSIFIDDFLALGDNDDTPVEFVQVPFHHPQFIMFSSGTTGAPKCMVHSVGVGLTDLFIL